MHCLDGYLNMVVTLSCLQPGHYNGKYFWGKKIVLLTIKKKTKNTCCNFSTKNYKTTLYLDLRCEHMKKKGHKVSFCFIRQA